MGKATHFDWTEWTEWTPLEALEFSMVPDSPGAYVIATDRPIHRAIGTDDEGFLDVGESDCLSTRLWQFKRCATKRGCTGHMAGWRYAFFRFERHFPISGLRVRWIKAATKEAAYAAEGRLLRSYLMRHCELPPLNYKFNWDGFEDGAFDGSAGAGLVST